MNMDHWWRAIPGAAFVFLMGVGSTIVFDQTCHGVTFGNYGTLDYYNCLPTQKDSHLPAPLAGWIIMTIGLGMLYLALQPFIHRLCSLYARQENNVSDTEQPSAEAEPRSSKGSDTKWKITAIAAVAALLATLITLVVTGTNRTEEVTPSPSQSSSQPSLSGPDWIIWEDGGTQYMTLDATWEPGASQASFYVDIACYTGSAAMIWVGWNSDITYWGSQQDNIEATIRVITPDGKTTEYPGGIFPNVIPQDNLYAHYFSVRNNADAAALAEILSSSYELRLEVFADFAFWGVTEESSPKDSIFDVHATGTIFPGAYNTFLPQLTQCPYQDFYGTS